MVILVFVSCFEVLKAVCQLSSSLNKVFIIIIIIILFYVFPFWVFLGHLQARVRREWFHDSYPSLNILQYCHLYRKV